MTQRSPRRPTSHASWLAALAALALLPTAAAPGCGGAPTPDAATPAAPSASAPAPSTSDTPPDAAAPPPESVPTRCASEDPCLPPAEFVDRLCKDSYYGLALYLFQTSQPWTHAYMLAEPEAVYASGGLSGEGNMMRDEEVLLLREHGGGSGGMTVSGSGGWDVLRWDGSCATVGTGDVTTTAPRAPKYAMVAWQYVDDNIQEALGGHPDIEGPRRARRTECKGVTSGAVSLECVRADKALADGVVKAVRGGATVPMPTQVPKPE